MALSESHLRSKLMCNAGRPSTFGLKQTLAGGDCVPIKGRQATGLRTQACGPTVSAAEALLDGDLDADPVGVERLVAALGPPHHGVGRADVLCHVVLLIGSRQRQTLPVKLLESSQ